jgi:hypothetical protein
MSYGYPVSRVARSGHSGVAVVVNSGAREFPNYQIHLSSQTLVLVKQPEPCQLHMVGTIDELYREMAPATIHMTPSEVILPDTKTPGSMHLTHTEVIL